MGLIYFQVLSLILAFFSGCWSWADTSDTLPADISSPMFKFGSIQAINQKYDSSGQLWRLGDLKSVEFDAKTLAKLSPKAQTLINTLNTFGNRNLGDALNLGVIQFDIDAQVNYFSPVYAHGLTKNWTLAFAIPVVNFQNKVRISQSFSNIDFYKREFGGQSPELDRALNTDIRAETLKAISDAGYKPLSDKNETFLHDVQLVSLYKFYEKDRLTWLHKAALGLPTGPKYDPDDLLALNKSGQTSVENGVVMAVRWNSQFRFLSSLSYLYYLPDQITKRIPKSEDDVLPDASTKESVRRVKGSSTIFKNEIDYKIADQYKVGTGYAYTQKNSDQYSGTDGRRYDLASLNSDEKEHVLSLSLAYDTIQSFFKKQSQIPLIFSYDISDTVAGRNVERKLIQEINFILFY